MSGSTFPRSEQPGVDAWMWWSGQLHSRTEWIHRGINQAVNLGRRRGRKRGCRRRRGPNQQIRIRQVIPDYPDVIEAQLALDGDGGGGFGANSVRKNFQRPPGKAVFTAPSGSRAATPALLTSAFIFISIPGGAAEMLGTLRGPNFGSRFCRIVKTGRSLTALRLLPTVNSRIKRMALWSHHLLKRFRFPAKDCDQGKKFQPLQVKRGG